MHNFDMMEHARNLRTDIKFAIENKEELVVEKKDELVLIWLVEQARRSKQFEDSFTDYTNTLNEARRKRDSVKNKLSIALKTIKEQKQLIKEQESNCVIRRVRK